MRTLGLSLTLAVSLCAGTSALSQPAAPEPSPIALPTTVDPAWKVNDVIAFIGIKKGDKVADVMAGRFTASLAQAVGPSGKVYAVEAAEALKVHPEALDRMKELSTKSPNVVVSDNSITAPLPSGLDAVFIRWNYHDLYNQFMGGSGKAAALNKAVFAALKPGGVYVVLDHAAAAGTGVDSTQKLHRIDPARVKEDALAAGFKFDAESSVLANKADDHTKNVFDPSIRNHTDQFLLRFKKPN
jgi:predicted methyltransferase